MPLIVDAGCGPVKSDKMILLSASRLASGRFLTRVGLYQQVLLASPPRSDMMSPRLRRNELVSSHDSYNGFTLSDTAALARRVDDTCVGGPGPFA